MKPALLSIILILSVSSFGSGFLEPADVRNEEHAKFACSQLGELCEKYKRECNPIEAPMPNTCLAIVYFRLEVAKERCGDKKYIECDEKNRKFSLKVVHELNLPNIGNPKRDIASKECESVGMYSVTSAQLKSFANKVYEVFKYIREPIEDYGPPYYRDHEEYYECIEERVQ
jgi:hypothetical protein